MTTVKKTAVKKTTAKSAPEKAAEEVIVAGKAEVKAPATKAEAPAAKAEAPAKTAKTVKKPVAKKTAAKAEVKVSMNVQFGGKSYTTEDLVKIAKDVWRYDLKQKAADFKSVELYVKPEDGMAYYVINGKEAGSFYI